MDIFESTFKRYNKHLREIATSRAEKRIVAEGNKVEDVSADDLVVMVQEEEDKLKDEMQQQGILALLALLGLSLLG